MVEATLTFKVGDKLKDEFVAAAALQGHSPDMLLCSFMHSYIEAVQDSTDYAEWFRQEVEAGIRDCRDGRILTQEEVTARAEKRTARLMKIMKDSTE